MLSGPVKRNLNVLKKIGLLAGLGIFLSILPVKTAQAANSVVFTLTVICDGTSPVIHHKPIKLVNVIGNKIIIKAGVTDDYELNSLSLYYKKHGDKEYKQVKQDLDVLKNPPPTTKKMASQIYVYNSISTFDFKMEIPPDVITTDGVDYYLTATDAAGSTSCFSDAGYSQTVPMLVVPVTIEINPKHIASILGTEGGTIVLADGNPDDGQTSLIVPPNALYEPTEISISQIYDLDTLLPGNGATKTKRPAAAYEFSPGGLSFAGLVTINLLYFDLDKDGFVDGTNISADDLRMFWWDGYDWHYVGGKVDKVNNIVTAEVGHFSIYALFPARELAVDDYRPKTRIITPATADGVNDIAVFDGLDNKKITINIFDVTGKKVKTISYPPYQWDGRDDEGRLVESGVYIYQFEVDGKLISGMIAVAK